MRSKALGVCGKLRLLCFPFLCCIFMLGGGGVIIFIMWSVEKLKLFCFPFLCWGGIILFIMDHPPGHTFYDMQGKLCLLSPVSSMGDPFRCRSIYSAPFGERMLWTQQRWWCWNHDTIEHIVWWYTDQLIHTQFVRLFLSELDWSYSNFCQWSMMAMSKIPITFWHDSKLFNGVWGVMAKYTYIN